MLPFLAMPPGTRPTGGRCVTDIRQQGVPAVPAAGRRFHAYTAKHLDALAARAGLDASERLAVRAVATVLPFRTNDYVVENPCSMSVPGSSRSRRRCSTLTGARRPR